MIVVDTNVISELMHGDPHPAVLAWVAGAAPRADLHDVRQLGGILYGIGALPEGRRRSALAAAAEAMVRGGFRRAHPAVRGRRRGALSQKSD